MEKTTDFCKVTAVIRTGVLERVEQRLQELGVHGICVTSVKGHGEYADFYSRDCMTTHARVEIFTSAERADDVVQAIMEAAYTGREGRWNRGCTAGQQALPHPPACGGAAG